MAFELQWAYLRCGRSSGFGLRAGGGTLLGWKWIAPYTAINLAGRNKKGQGGFNPLPFGLRLRLFLDRLFLYPCGLLQVLRDSHVELFRDAVN